MQSPSFFFVRFIHCASGWHKPALPLPSDQNDSAMFEFIITLALAALAIWLLVDSAVEFTQDTRDNIPATEP